jgi:hypothetical protein
VKSARKGGVDENDQPSGVEYVMTTLCGSLNFGVGITEDIPKNCLRITKLRERLQDVYLCCIYDLLLAFWESKCYSL